MAGLYYRWGGLKVLDGKGSRIIVYHAGTNKPGFDKERKSIFQSRETGKFKLSFRNDCWSAHKPVCNLLINYLADRVSNCGR